jgi:hypothetical protein
MPHFSPTQKCLMEILGDGNQHPRDELMKCLWDELGKPVNLSNHLTLLRKKLHPIGQDVVSERHRGDTGYLYRLVRLGPTMKNQ